jgi:hypothetical protein
MFSWNGRLYYTLSGNDPRLYHRWFTPESGVIDADTFVASGASDGRNWSTVNGLQPPLHRPHHQRPTIDGQTWQSRGLFVLNLPA